MAYFKTQQVEVFTPEGQLGTDPAGVVRMVNLQPATATTLFEVFGVEVANGYVLYDDSDAADYYVVHGRVAYNDQTFAIVSVPRRWDVFGAASHLMVALQEVR